MRTSLSAALIALVTTAASSTAQNNECANSTLVFDGPNGPYNNVGATTSLPAWPCGNAGNDVWFAYSATCTGTLTIDTCGSAFDTVLQVFDISCVPYPWCSYLTTGPCNDDSCGLQSSITVPIVGGGAYFIRVGGYGGAIGGFFLNIACTGNGNPSTDECAGATPLPSLAVHGPFSNAGHTTSLPAWPCGGGGNDRWFEYVATCTGPHRFYTCGTGTNFDTTLEVLRGACGCPSQMTSLACNDDSCGLQSSVTVNLQASNSYRIRVGGFGGATGNFTLGVALGTGTGSTTPLGIGACGGTNVILTSGDPNLGGTITTVVGGSGSALIGYGFTPLNLFVCGNCAIGHEWSVFVTGLSSTLTIPCDPNLVGASVYTQGIVLWPVNPGCPGSYSFSTTDTERIVIG